MKAVPLELQKRFGQKLKRKDIPDKFQGEYKKWLQYYLDFCRKYELSPENHESLPPFILKLAEKRQTRAQQDRASNSIYIYYQIIKEKATYGKTKSFKPEDSKKHL